MTHVDALTALVQPAPDAPKVWGRSPAERAKRLLAPMKVPVADTEGSLPAGPVLMLRGDAVYHQSVLSGMKGAPNAALVDDQGRPVAAHVADGTALKEAAWAWLSSDAGEIPAGLRRVVTTDVASLWNAKLRRRDDPYAMRLTRENLPGIEKRIFLGTYKGVTDFVTKYWWPLPARIVTGWCVKLGLTPNFVTAVSGILAVVVCWLFARGEFAYGLLLGWPMTFLDTVDGKLARVTLTSSKFGDIFDHGIDLLHPPAWYYFWAVGLGPVLGGMFWPLFGSLMGTYVAGRLCEGYFARRFGFHMHVWRPFDAAFRLVLARRNPNLIILTAALLVGRPDVGIWLVAIWTVATFLVHVVQITQSVMAARRGPVRSWLDQASQDGRAGKS